MAWLLMVAVACGLAGSVVWAAGAAQQQQRRALGLGPAGEGVAICGETLLAMTLLLLAVHFCS
ncbi:hypothetical protein [Pseudomonas eucalypticola]|uniref:Uncharacterized protein n=1 Tax=Pseudomonas eucalypticola TaxID=2599595 RepID=A0A7D5HYA9_9PSED|nr:hypothetical protein [Pseudomonas eucalypticola]QKZ05531.1 hypothetical protein HWQ56_17715 [Pseudomonas eucalypticola]